MTERLYRKFEERVKGIRPDLRPGLMKYLNDKFPQPAPYSPANARKYFEAQIETVPHLKALGLHLDSLMVCFDIHDRYPFIPIYDYKIAVERSDMSPSIYRGTSASDAWTAFLKEVDKVYPGMCLDWLEKEEPGVFGFGRHGWNDGVISGGATYPLFNTRGNSIMAETEDSGIDVKRDKTIADFLAEYQRQHLQKEEPEAVELDDRECWTKIDTLTGRVEKLEKQSDPIRFLGVDVKINTLAEKVKVIDMEQNAHCELLDGIGKRLANHIKRGKK